MKAHNILGSIRPALGRCAVVRLSMYWGPCTHPSKRFGRLAHIEDPTTPGEGDA
jgi:hypothetical protein